ncbi:glyoxalase [Afipia sp. P52-10]|jgi:catechol 2,3-dioxygenase-like lactoylglutathione lyase family enzyme|uniref:VOC family protein n=1 Tax=Afipia sp. P52-10 TaxID=1429916 RepID=UPI0003DF278D|nr:VOC family protein [Afipia sp. P52-10]ETR75010.1 glyoxalase [Afipia sp. P52-10]
MPRLERVIETAIYVDDLARAAAFYETVMELPLLASDSRFRAYDVGGQSVFLVFKRGATLEEVHLPGGSIPPHDGHGPLHLAFGIAVEELPAWERRLADNGIAIEARTDWPRGGKSIYFRDPDNHVLELATRGIWATY